MPWHTSPVPSPSLSCYACHEMMDAMKDLWLSFPSRFHASLLPCPCRRPLMPPLLTPLLLCNTILMFFRLIHKGRQVIVSGVPSFQAPGFPCHACHANAFSFTPPLPPLQRSMPCLSSTTFDSPAMPCQKDAQSMLVMRGWPFFPRHLPLLICLLVGYVE